MKEQKFRVWLMEDKQLLPVEMITYRRGYMDVQTEPKEYFPKAKQPFVLMRYIDLMDDYDEEIFEGDIVKYSIANGFNYEIDGIGTVEYHNGGYTVDQFPICELTEIEIIGNIYETPELLGGN